MKRKLIIIALVVALVAMFSMPATLFADPVTAPANISITKVADITTAYPGDTITYTITVTNTGSWPLLAAVQDSMLWSGDNLLGLMLPGQSITITPNPTYVVQEADIGTTLINTANVWTLIPMDGYGPTASACAEVTVLEREPEKPEVGNITVVKRDPGGALLAGAGFTVYLQASGNPALPEGFTDGSGMITFAGLPLDTYIVRETTAPAGFGLAPDQIAVLNVDNLAVTVNFVDDPIPTGGGETTTTTTTTAVVTPPVVEVLGVTEELPFTGQSMWLYIIGAAMLALAGGLTFVLRAAKSKE